MKKPKEKINQSLSSSSSIYYTNMSIPEIKKYDSGFSETTTTIQQPETILEQILSFERIYYEHLKQYIIKYSRPLRRYLNPDEIVDLFQNIEKVNSKENSEKFFMKFSFIRFQQYRNQLFVNVKNYSMQRIYRMYQFQLFINHGYENLSSKDILIFVFSSRV